VTHGEEGEDGSRDQHTHLDRKQHLRSQGARGNRLETLAGEEGFQSLREPRNLRAEAGDGRSADGVKYAGARPRESAARARREMTATAAAPSRAPGRSHRGCTESRARKEKAGMATERLLSGSASKGLCSGIEIASCGHPFRQRPQRQHEAKEKSAPPGSAERGQGGQGRLLSVPMSQSRDRQSFSHRRRSNASR
jgi:hypothetical protein